MPALRSLNRRIQSLGSASTNIETDSPEGKVCGKSARNEIDLRTHMPDDGIQVLGVHYRHFPLTLDIAFKLSFLGNGGTCL